MGVATFAGRTFRIDPESVSWNFEVKTKDTPTVGGKVIQVFGTNVSDMEVIGSFGRAGWQGQLAFLDRMKEIASAQAQAGRTSRSSVPPARFTYPPRKWDFLVYLAGYTDANGGKAVRHHNTEVNPKWKLTLFIVEDMSELGVKKVATDAYISRLSKGIGWKRTLFNGPYGEANLDAVMGNLGPYGGNTPTEMRYATAPSGASGTVFPPAVERWRPLVAKYWPANLINQALSVIEGESSGDPNAVNPIVTKYGNAKGLFQHLNELWLERAIAVGFPLRSVFDPEANIAAAYWLYSRTNNWNAWEAKPKVTL